MKKLVGHGAQKQVSLFFLPTTPLFDDGIFVTKALAGCGMQKQAGLFSLQIQ